MKKIILTVITLLVILSGCAEQTQSKQITNATQATAATYRIEYTFTMVSNDSVGNEWQTSLTRDGQPLHSGDTVTAPANSLVTLTATVTEVDQYPDTTTTTFDLPLQDSGTTTTTITVRENGGAYVNHTAVWEVTCTTTKIS